MATFEPLVWQRKPISARRPRPVGQRASAHDPLTEWTAPPIGRLGRPLLAEIEAYLEFFAIAHGPQPGAAEPW